MDPEGNGGAMDPGALGGGMDPVGKGGIELWLSILFNLERSVG
jgi:hypothetical protein